MSDQHNQAQDGTERGGSTWEVGRDGPIACPASARGCDITCACCGECWNIDWLLRGETDPRLAHQEIVRLLLGMGCPECEWGLRINRREDYKTLHVRSLLIYLLSCEPAEGLARPELLSWMLHDINNLLREHLGVPPIVHDAE
jgi:hypothetical protein